MLEREEVSGSFVKEHESPHKLSSHLIESKRNKNDYSYYSFTSGETCVVLHWYVQAFKISEANVQRIMVFKRLQLQQSTDVRWGISTTLCSSEHQIESTEPGCKWFGLQGSCSREKRMSGQFLFIFSSKFQKERFYLRTFRIEVTVILLKFSRWEVFLKTRISLKKKKSFSKQKTLVAMSQGTENASFDLSTRALKLPHMILTRHSKVLDQKIQNYQRPL